jgi:micrococcal nuclease
MPAISHRRAVRPGPLRGHRVFAALFALALSGAPAPAARAQVPAGLDAGGTAVVAEIVDGDTLVLETGRQVRLVGIQAPKLPLGRAGFVAWPLAAEAKAALGRLALGHRLTLAYGGRREDRHGRILAHLFDEAGVWIQGALLDRGMARVYSFADNRALVAKMLAREEAARRARRGIWAERFYAVRTPDEAARYIGGFELVEGRVYDVAEVRGRTYVNFAADWHTDFTITIDAKARRLFADAGVAPDSYRGRVVRVRGWLKSFNGPMIEATHPEQIEVIDE